MARRSPPNEASTNIRNAKAIYVYAIGHVNLVPTPGKRVVTKTTGGVEHHATGHGTKRTIGVHVTADSLANSNVSVKAGRGGIAAGGSISNNAFGKGAKVEIHVDSIQTYDPPVKTPLPQSTVLVPPGVLVVVCQAGSYEAGEGIEVQDRRPRPADRPAS